MLINVEVEAIMSEVHLNYPVDTREEEKVAISQETKFQGPEETKRRVKKEVNQVDRNNIKIVKNVNSKSR